MSQAKQTSANDEVSVLALFQSAVYGNDRLIFMEKKSFENVVINNVDNELNKVQKALDSMNKCNHSHVSNKCEKRDSVKMHYIECDDCGKELYHYSEYKCIPTKNNINPKREIIRKDSNWYNNVYINCKHPEPLRQNTLCKRCGKSVYFILD